MNCTHRSLIYDNFNNSVKMSGSRNIESLVSKQHNMELSFFLISHTRYKRLGFICLYFIRHWRTDLPPITVLFFLIYFTTCYFLFISNTTLTFCQSRFPKLLIIIFYYIKIIKSSNAYYHYNCSFLSCPLITIQCIINLLCLPNNAVIIIYNALQLS